jgi:teichoic acid transport system permease protein
MTDAAVAESTGRVDLAQLAAQHGLRDAGLRPSLGEYTRKLWAYRHFIWAFAHARHVSTFSATRLGSLWQVLTPLVNAAVYFLIFGVVLDTRRGIGNFIGFLCTGVFLFGFTQAVVMSGVRSITDSLVLVRALNFPRGCLPIAAMLTQLQQLLASVAVLFVIVLATGEPITFKWLTMIPILILCAMFNAGLALVFARLGVKLHDLKQVLPFVLRTWMYASGVFYSVAKFTANLPHPVAAVLRTNPVAVFIELAHHALLKNPPDAGMSLTHMWEIAIFWGVVAGVGGYLYFWRGEQEYGRG